MPRKESQKVKGCKKCGRISKRDSNTPISQYVRNKISAKDYFSLTNQTPKGV